MLFSSLVNLADPVTSIGSAWLAGMATGAFIRLLSFLGNW